MSTSVLQKLSLVVGCLVLSLLAAEGVLRLLPPGWIDHGLASPDWSFVIRDPILGWRNEPGYRQREFSIDLAGFRGPEIVQERERDGSRALRIVCIGDSRTFGIWLDKEGFRYDNDYPSRLQRLIRTQDRSTSAEVINAGVIGYSSSHGLRQYVTEVLALEPDVVVVAFGFNDHSPAFDPPRRAEEPQSPTARRLYYALSRSGVFRLSAAVYLRMSFLHPKRFSVPWATPERYAENLRRFGEISREHGSRLLLLAHSLRPLERGPSLPPFPGAADTPYDLLGAKDLAGLHRLDDQYLDILRATAREEGIPLVDMGKVFARPTALEAFGDYDLVHFNGFGADLVAEEVHEEMRRLGWLEPSAGGAGGAVPYSSVRRETRSADGLGDERP